MLHCMIRAIINIGWRPVPRKDLFEKGMNSQTRIQLWFAQRLTIPKKAEGIFNTPFNLCAYC